MRVKIGVFFLQIDSFREISFHSANSTPTHWLTYFRVTLLVSLREIDRPRLFSCENFPSPFFLFLSKHLLSYKFRISGKFKFRYQIL